VIALQEELWITREEFEKQLEQEMNGFKMERIHMQEVADRKIRNNNLRSLVFLDASEQALNQYKLDTRQQ
jgi:hypothetical protein